MGLTLHSPVDGSRWQWQTVTDWVGVWGYSPFEIDFSHLPVMFVGYRDAVAHPDANRLEGMPPLRVPSAPPGSSGNPPTPAETSRTNFDPLFV